MFRFFSLVLTVLLANISFAEDVLPIVFEDSLTVSIDGREQKCNLYYILVGENNALNRGELIQITQLHSDREHYGLTTGRFTISKLTDRLTIYWPAAAGEKSEKIERARLKTIDKESKQISYEIYSHDDRSQVGQKLRARLVNFDRLPEWVQNAVRTQIEAKRSSDAPSQEEIVGTWNFVSATGRSRSSMTFHSDGTFEKSWSFTSGIGTSGSNERGTWSLEDSTIKVQSVGFVATTFADGDEGGSSNVSSSKTLRFVDGTIHDGNSVYRK